MYFFRRPAAYPCSLAPWEQLPPLPHSRLTRQTSEYGTRVVITWRMRGIVGWHFPCGWHVGTWRVFTAHMGGILVHCGRKYTNTPIFNTSGSNMGQRIWYRGILVSHVDLIWALYGFHSPDGAKTLLDRWRTLWRKEGQIDLLLFLLSSRISNKIEPWRPWCPSKGWRPPPVLTPLSSRAHIQMYPIHVNYVIIWRTVFSLGSPT